MRVFLLRRRVSLVSLVLVVLGLGRVLVGEERRM